MERIATEEAESRQRMKPLVAIAVAASDLEDRVGRLRFPININAFPRRGHYVYIRDRW